MRASHVSRIGYSQECISLAGFDVVYGSTRGLEIRKRYCGRRCRSVAPVFDTLLSLGVPGDDFLESDALAFSGMVDDSALLYSVRTSEVR
jgi:hypothetical protein